MKQIRDYIVKKKLNSALAFERFLQILGAKESGRIGKNQFRELMKRENMPFNIPQIDFLFAKFDFSHDGYVDLEKWSRII